MSGPARSRTWLAIATLCLFVFSLISICVGPSGFSWNALRAFIPFNGPVANQSPTKNFDTENWDTVNWDTENREKATQTSADQANPNLPSNDPNVAPKLPKESPPTTDHIDRNILLHLRLPRTLCGLLVGIALGTAGVAFQCLFRNPLADPYIIGASSGAALGAAVAVLFATSQMILGVSTLSLFALAGSIGVVLLVFGLGKLFGSGSSLTLLLSGIAISSMANALVSLLLYLNNRDAIATIVTWMMGSFADSNWSNVWLMLGSSSIAFFFIWFSSRQLDAYSLGDTTAQSLGLSIKRFQLQILIAASIATAFSVSTSGIIGFIGLISPQLARMLVGTEHKSLVPMSALVGAILLVLADGIARVVIAPVELPVGILTALLGGPFFLALVLQSAISRYQA